MRRRVILSVALCQGNVILTDGRYEVLTLLRSHRDDARGMATLPRHPYPLATIRLDEVVECHTLAAAFNEAAPDATLRGGILSRNADITPFSKKFTARLVQCCTFCGWRGYNVFEQLNLKLLEVLRVPL